MNLFTNVWSLKPSARLDFSIIILVGLINPPLTHLPMFTFGFAWSLWRTEVGWGLLSLNEFSISLFLNLFGDAKPVNLDILVKWTASIYLEIIFWCIICHSETSSDVKVWLILLLRPSLKSLLLFRESNAKRVFSFSESTFSFLHFVWIEALRDFRALVFGLQIWLLLELVVNIFFFLLLIILDRSMAGNYIKT